MDPIDTSIDERMSKKKSENSESEPEEDSFMSKLGSILFFGCGNNKEKEKSTMM